VLGQPSGERIGVEHGRLYFVACSGGTCAPSGPGRRCPRADGAHSTPAEIR
jgi:hypothetical protein